MVSYIQSNNIEGGKLAGEAMGKLLNGKGEVLVLNNEPGTPIGDARVEGFKQGLAEFPGIRAPSTSSTHTMTPRRPPASSRRRSHRTRT